LPDGRDGQEEEQEPRGLLRVHGHGHPLVLWAGLASKEVIGKDYVCLRSITTGQKANLGSVCP
jgi:hypothetical protein